jgi:hypothetical protein
MENGEANALRSVARTRGIVGGVLFQPYIELSQGWDPKWLGETYAATGRLQANAALEACAELKRRRLL